MKTPHDLVQAAKSHTQEISLDQAEQAISQADALIDVREADEYAVAHIPGAVHMSRGMLEFKIGQHPVLSARDSKIVLYCKTSGRAALCAASLKEMGYLQVQSIAGGIDAWIAAGKNIAQPSTPSFD
jgi:rhodanese-related sulfurtransferase